MGYNAKTPEETRYLDCPRVNCTDIGGGVYLIGFDDTFVYEDDRGLLGLRNPTYQEFVDFLTQDKTDEQEYVSPIIEEVPGKGTTIVNEDEVFICTDFALMLRENANRAGWRCACLALPILHTINAFETTDKGLVWYDPLSKDPRNILAPVYDRYDPYPVPLGDEAYPRTEPWESIIVYIW